MTESILRVGRTLLNLPAFRWLFCASFLVGCNVVTHSDDGSGGIGGADPGCDDGGSVVTVVSVGHASSGIGVGDVSTGVGGPVTTTAAVTTGAGVTSAAIAVTSSGTGGMTTTRVCYIGDGTCVPGASFDLVPYTSFLCGCTLGEAGCGPFEGEVIGSTQDGNGCCYDVVGECATF